MSPLTIKKIKEAKGNVRVKQESGNLEWAIQIMEGGTWKTIYKNVDRTVCESVVSQAAQQVILG